MLLPMLTDFDLFDAHIWNFHLAHDKGGHHLPFEPPQQGRCLCTPPLAGGPSRLFQNNDSRTEANFQCQYNSWLNTSPGEWAEKQCNLYS